MLWCQYPSRQGKYRGLRDFAETLTLSTKPHREVAKSPPHRNNSMPVGLTNPVVNCFLCRVFVML